MKRVENNIMKQSTIVIWKVHNKSIMYETWRFDHETEKWIGYHSIPSWREEDIFLRYVLDDTDQLFNHLREMIYYDIQIIYQGNVIAGNEWTFAMKNLNSEAFHDDDEVLATRFISVIEKFLETDEEAYEKNKWKWIEYPTPFVNKLLDERRSFDEDIIHIIDSELEEKTLLKRIIDASFKDTGLSPEIFLEWRIYNSMGEEKRTKYPFHSDIKNERFRNEIESRVSDFSDSLKVIIPSLMNFDKEVIEEEDGRNIFISFYPVLDIDRHDGMTRFERKENDFVKVYMEVSIYIDEVNKLLKERDLDFIMDPSLGTYVSIIIETKNPEFHKGQSGFRLMGEYPERIHRYEYNIDEWYIVE